MALLKVLVLSEYFWPDQASTGRLLGDLLGRLKEDNPDWHIDVLTSARVYRGEPREGLPRHETWRGVHIWRLASLRTGKDTFWRRALSDLLFSARATVRAGLWRHDVILVVTNPPLLPMLAALLSSLKGTPVVYLIHDLYPDVPVALGLWRADGVAVRLLRTLQRFSLERAARIIVLGECMKEYLQQQYRIPPDRIAVIPNWATVTPPGNPADGPLVRRTFDLVYSGNIGESHDFDTILKAAERLQTVPTIRFLVIGDGARAEYLRRQVERMHLSSLTFRPFLPEADFAAVLGEASLGLVTLEPGMEGLGVPSKIYNLLACGVPLLAVVGERSEVARLIRQEGVGYCVGHGDVDRFVESVLDAYHNPDKWLAMSREARDYAFREARLEVAVKRYERELMLAVTEARQV